MPDTLTQPQFHAPSQSDTPPVQEFELKFQVPAPRAAAVEVALARGNSHRVRLRARYFDTPGSALEAAGLVLRLRHEGRQWVQTAKGPGPGGFARLEHNAPVRSGGARGLPDPARHAGHPLEGLLAHALAGDADSLQCCFETDVVRLARTVRAADCSVEIALDRGEVRAGSRSAPVLELEFELKQGTPAALIELAQTWCDAHGLWLDPLTKSALGRRLARGETQGPPVMARALEGSGRQLLPAIVDAGLQQALANARELAAGTGEDEHVHQLRVGLRRLRTALRELQDLQAWTLPDPEVEEQLAALFIVLGEHRDQSTLVPAVLEELARHGAPVAAWDAALPDVGGAIRASGTQHALLRLVALAEGLRAGEGVPARQLRQLSRERLRALHRKVLRQGRHFDLLPQAERHKVRKQLKRLRYLAELVRPLYRAGAVDDYVHALRDLQDALGRYQDAVAGQALFARRAEADPHAWFAVGWIAAREQDLALACAQACRRTARAARPFWD